MEATGIPESTLPDSGASTESAPSFPYTSLAGKGKRILGAPAVNTTTWRHPSTTPQIKMLEDEWGVEFEGKGNKEGCLEVWRPEEKELACVGDGAMREWSQDC